MPADLTRQRLHPILRIILDITYITYLYRDSCRLSFNLLESLFFDSL